MRELSRVRRIASSAGAALVCATVASAAAPPVKAPPTEPPPPRAAPLVPRWEIGVIARIGVPSGETRGGPGADIGLDELGAERSTTLELRLRYRLGRSAVRASLVGVSLTGSDVLTRDVFYGGATIPSGTAVAARPRLRRLTVAYDRHLKNLGRGRSLSGTLGLTYVFLRMRIRDPDTDETLAEVDFTDHERPVPLVGLVYGTGVSRTLRLVVSAEGGLLPGIGAGRDEQGEDVTLTQRHLDLGLRLSQTLSADWTVEMGYRLAYLFERQETDAQENVFSLTDHAFFAGASVKF